MNVESELRQALVGALTVDNITTVTALAERALASVLPFIAADNRRFAFIEAEARTSPTGISFDYVPSVEGEPSGWRFMRRHFIGDAKKDIRSAIDAAQRAIDVPAPATEQVQS